MPQKKVEKDDEDDREEDNGDDREEDDEDDREEDDEDDSDFILQKKKIQVQSNFTVQLMTKFEHGYVNGSGTFGGMYKGIYTK